MKWHIIFISLLHSHHATSMKDYALVVEREKGEKISGTGSEHWTCNHLWHVKHLQSLITTHLWPVTLNNTDSCKIWFQVTQTHTHTKTHVAIYNIICTYIILCFYTKKAQHAICYHWLRLLLCSLESWSWELNFVCYFHTYIINWWPSLLLCIVTKKWLSSLTIADSINPGWLIFNYECTHRHVVLFVVL